MILHASSACAAKADAARMANEDLQDKIRIARERALEQRRGYLVLRLKDGLHVRCSWDKHDGEVVASVSSRGVARLAHAHSRLESGRG